LSVADGRQQDLLLQRDVSQQPGTELFKQLRVNSVR
jgi:hypothetical protein